MKKIPTASATIGPFFPGRFVDEGANDLALLDGRAAPGTPITLSGTVVQADGMPMENLIVELWQADAAGQYDDSADAGFCGWGRTATDAQGRYRFRTIRPGAVESPDGARRAPHLNLALLSSGAMFTLHTVMYFEDAPGNSEDALLAAVPAARRALLVARRDAGTAAEGDAPVAYRFDIRLRGADETPFFDV